MNRRLTTILIACLTAFSLLCGTVCAQGIFNISDDFHQSRGTQREKAQFARIDSIAGDQVTLTLGTLNKSGKNSDQSSNETITDNFTAGTETATLTAQSEEVKQTLTELKAGDIVCVRYSDQNVLEDIRKAEDRMGHKGGTPARIDSIDGDKVTLTLGSFQRESVNNEDTQQNSQAPSLSESFVAGTETVTLTAQNEEVKQTLAELKAGDIVCVRYSDQNVLEDIRKAEDRMGRKGGTPARIDSIDGDKVALTLGTLQREPINSEDNAQDSQTPNPSDSFVPGTETVTLTFANDNVKSKAGNFKAGDIVFIQYNDQNQLESINDSNSAFKGGHHGKGGRGKGFGRDFSQNGTANSDNSQSQQTSNQSGQNV